MNLDSAVLLAVGVLVFGVTFVPIIWGLKHARRKAEWEHMERMKALEMGRPLPGEVKSPPRPASHAGIAIGTSVPIGVFGCAWLASLTAGYEETMWIMAGVVGLGAVICGTILAKQSIGSEISAAKPHIEDDAYDVVARRG
jgi:hypothetical protein